MTSVLHDAKLFQRRRKELGISQVALAQASGVPRAWIASVERQRIPLRGPRVLKLWQTLSDVEIARREQPPIIRLSDLGCSPQSEQNPYFLQRVVAVQDELISALQAALADVTAEQSAEIERLRQQVADLRQMYAAGELEALAHDKFERLNEKLFPSEDQEGE